MFRQQIANALVLALTCGSALTVIAQQSDQSDSRSPRERSSLTQSTTNQNSDPNAGTAAMDSLLATNLALMNQEEIAMGQIAAQRARNEEVRQFAEMMVEDHLQMLQGLAQFTPIAHQAAGIAGGAAGGSQSNRWRIRNRTGRQNESQADDIGSNTNSPSRGAASSSEDIPSDTGTTAGDGPPADASSGSGQQSGDPRGTAGEGTNLSPRLNPNTADGAAGDTGSGANSAGPLNNDAGQGTNLTPSQNPNGAAGTPGETESDQTDGSGGQDQGAGQPNDPQQSANRGVNDGATAVGSDWSGQGIGDQQQVDLTSLIELNQEVAQRCQQSLSEMLERFQGQGFDMAYIGRELVTHMNQLEMLTVYEKYAGPELRRALAQAREKVQRQMLHARQLSKRL